MTSSVDNLLDVSDDYISRGEILWNRFDEVIEDAIDNVLFAAMKHASNDEAVQILHSLWIAQKA
jgi:hypothetical protein